MLSLQTGSTHYNFASHEPPASVLHMLPWCSWLQEILGLFCQFLQLGSTYFIITSATNKYQPLEEPWFQVQQGPVPYFQALATCITAVGSGVLLAGVLTGHVDGTGGRCAGSCHIVSTPVLATARCHTVEAVQAMMVMFRATVTACAKFWLW